MEKFEDNNVSDEEEQIPDKNTCTDNELQQLFAHKLNLTSELSISLQKSYILHLANSTDYSKIAAGTSDNIVHIFTPQDNFLTKLSTKTDFIQNKNDSICGICFANADSNLLFVGTESGCISMIDLRADNIISTFKDNSDVNTKPLCSFDVNQNNRILCAGTERINQDAFLLFFDLRNPDMVMGGYCESHDDDITQVKFNSTDPDLLATGSTDGLINIFDVSNTNEDDALQSSLNTDSSVQTINWHKNIFGIDQLSCLTHTNDFQLYDVAKSDLISSFTREQITEAIKRRSSMDCTVVNCHSGSDGNVILLAGSNFNNGECLRSLCLQNGTISPLTNFAGNKQIVRTSIYNDKNETMITGGESGILSIWTSAPSTLIKADSTSFKEKSKFKSNKHKNKPYS